MRQSDVNMRSPLREFSPLLDYFSHLGCAYRDSFLLAAEDDCRKLLLELIAVHQRKMDDSIILRSFKDLQTIPPQTMGQLAAVAAKSPFKIDMKWDWVAEHRPGPHVTCSHHLLH